MHKHYSRAYKGHIHIKFKTFKNDILIILIDLLTYLLIDKCIDFLFFYFCFVLFIDLLIYFGKNGLE